MEGSEESGLSGKGGGGLGGGGHGGGRLGGGLRWQRRGWRRRGLGGGDEGKGGEDGKGSDEGQHVEAGDRTSLCTAEESGGISRGGGTCDWLRCCKPERRLGDGRREGITYGSRDSRTRSLSHSIMQLLRSAGRREGRDTVSNRTGRERCV